MASLQQRIEQKWRWVLFGVIPLLGFVMHLHVFPKELQGIHAWRQCETGSNVLRFAREDMNILHPHVYSLEWEDGHKQMEFPIMQWVMALGYRLIGEEVWVMRILSWLIGLGSVFGMFLLSFSLFRSCGLALATAWAFHFSPVFFYYTANPLPDNLALMAGIGSLAWFVKGYYSGQRRWYWYSAAMLMLAVLAKLPFVLMLALPLGCFGWEWLRSRFRGWKALLRGALPYLLALIAPAAWYLSVIPTWHGNGVVKGILDSSAADLPEMWGIFWHNLISTLPELLLNYASVPFFIVGIALLFRKESRRARLFVPFLLLALGTAAYFIFELNMIGTAHDYYLFPFLPGLFLLVAYGMREAMYARQAWLRVVLAVALLAMPVAAAVRTYPRWEKTGFTTDLITMRDALQKAVPADAKIIAGHDLSPHIYLYHLQKRGWTISKDHLDPAKIESCIAQGAQYLYSSHRELDENPALKPYLGEMLQEIGVFRIYALKQP